MKQIQLDKCPKCGNSLRIVSKSKNVKNMMECIPCGYKQLSESRERVVNLCDALVEACLDRGIDTFLIKEHELTIEESLRGDSLLPLLINKYNQLIKGKEALPFSVVDDLHALLKLRVVYQEDLGNSNADYYNELLINSLDFLINETKDNRPNLSTNMLDINLLLDNMVPPSNTKYEKPSIVNANKQKNTEKETKKTGDDNLKEFQVIYSMADNRREDAKFGQLNKLKESGARLSKTHCLTTFQQTLDNEFPWFRKITEIFCRELTTRSLGTAYFKLPSIIMLGKPGIGKTAYCSRITELSGVPFNFLGLSGSTSNQVLAGTERGWTSAKPSLALQTILDTDTANPLIVLDEIDKAGGSEHNGHPHHTLLGLLEPSSSKRWYDPFVMGHVDLSHISWIATANDISQLPTTLLSRFRVVEVDAPDFDDYPAIVWRTRKNVCDEYGFDTRWLPEFTSSEWDWLEQYFKTPRLAKRATEELIKNILINPSLQIMN